MSSSLFLAQPGDAVPPPTTTAAPDTLSPADASTLTIALASTAAILLTGILVTALALHIRRRRLLSLDRIEHDLDQLERALREWQSQTQERDQAYRRSYHGGLALQRDWMEGVPAPRPVRVNKHRRMRSEAVIEAIKAEAERREAREKRLQAESVVRKPSTVRFVDEVAEPASTANPRLSVPLLRGKEPNRHSFLEDTRIRPFTMVSNDSPRSPPPAVVVFEEPRSVGVDEDEESVVMDLPMPRVFQRRGDVAEARPSQESIHVDEFGVDFPLPAGSPLLPAATRVESESDDEDEHDSRRDSQPMSMTTDDSDERDEEVWDMPEAMEPPTRKVEEDPLSALVL